MLPVLMAMRTLRPLKSTWPPGPLPSRSPMLTVRAMWCSASLMGHCSFSSRCCTCKQYRTCHMHTPQWTSCLTTCWPHRGRHADQATVLASLLANTTVGPHVDHMLATSGATRTASEAHQALQQPLPYMQAVLQLRYTHSTAHVEHLMRPNVLTEQPWSTRLMIGLSC